MISLMSLLIALLIQLTPIGSATPLSCDQPLDPRLAACVGTLNCKTYEATAFVYENNGQIAVAGHTFFDADLKPLNVECTFQNFAGGPKVKVTTPDFKDRDITQPDQDANTAKLAESYVACEKPIQPATDYKVGAELLIVTIAQIDMPASCEGKPTVYKSKVELKMLLGNTEAILFDAPLRLGGSGGALLVKCGDELCAAGVGIAGAEPGQGFSLGVKPASN